MIWWAEQFEFKHFATALSIKTRNYKLCISRYLCKDVDNFTNTGDFANEAASRELAVSGLASEL